MEKTVTDTLMEMFHEYVEKKLIADGKLVLDDDLPDRYAEYAEAWEAETGIPVDHFM